MEEKVQGDRRAEDLRQIAGDDGDFAKEPERQIDGSRIGFAAGLGEVAAGDDSEARAQRLKQDGHGVRHDQDPEQAVAEMRAAGEIGRPVAGVHVTDADEVGGAGEGEHAPPEGTVVRAHALMNLRERPGLRWIAWDHVKVPLVLNVPCACETPTAGCHGMFTSSTIVTAGAPRLRLDDTG